MPAFACDCKHLLLQDLPAASDRVPRVGKFFALKDRRRSYGSSCPLFRLPSSYILWMAAG